MKREKWNEYKKQISAIANYLLVSMAAVAILLTTIMGIDIIFTDVDGMATVQAAENTNNLLDGLSTPIRKQVEKMINEINEVYVTKPTETKVVVGYIYLGDSRFVGMNSAVDLDSKENTFVVAKVGEGYKWLIDHAQYEVKHIVEDNKDIDRWVLISGLGVNDLRNIDKYISFYDTLEDMDVFLVSVNPVEKVGCDRYHYDYNSLSTGMVSFNDRLKETDYQYIDTYSYMMEDGFATRDGVHYINETYEKIYNYIVDFINEYYKIE